VLGLFTLTGLRFEQVVSAHFSTHAMGVKTYRPNIIYKDKAMWTFVFTSPQRDPYGAKCSNVPTGANL
jgi:hypothetical protein